MDHITNQFTFSLSYIHQWQVINFDITHKIHYSLQAQNLHPKTQVNFILDQKLSSNAYITARKMTYIQ